MNVVREGSARWCALSWLLTVGWRAPRASVLEQGCGLGLLWYRRRPCALWWLSECSESKMRGGRDRCMIVGRQKIWSKGVNGASRLARISSPLMLLVGCEVAVG